MPIRDADRSFGVSQNAMTQLGADGNFVQTLCTLQSSETRAPPHIALLGAFCAMNELWKSGKPNSEQKQIHAASFVSRTHECVAFTQRGGISE